MAFSLSNLIGKLIAPFAKPRIIRARQKVELDIPTHYELTKDLKPVRLSDSSHSLQEGKDNPFFTDDDLPKIFDIYDINALKSSIYAPLPLDLSPSVSKVTIHDFTRIEIGEDLFFFLETSHVNGKQYSIENEWQSIPTKQDHFFSTPQPKSGNVSYGRPLRLASISNNLPNSKKWNLTFFDLIKPLLSPPFSIHFGEQITFLPPGKSPYPFQVEGIEQLTINDGFLLADEMGTGKTVMATLAMRMLFQKGMIRHTLILCPVSVLRVWEQHVADWSNGELLYAVVHGESSQRSLAWKLPFHVYITSYTTFRIDIKEERVHDPDKFSLIILDEAQYIKNRNSGRSRAVRQVASTYRWALTGTPLENSVDDVKALFSFLQPDVLDQNENYLPHIQRAIQPYMLRRLKKDVLKDLPPKTYETLRLKLSSKQRSEYNKILSQSREHLRDLERKRRVTRHHIFAEIMRLKQFCNFPGNSIRGPKSDAVREMVEEITASGQKVVVFSQFITNGIDKLEQVVQAYGAVKLVGGMTSQQRERTLTQFRSDHDTHVLLISLKAGGLGLTLTEASYVIHFDQWWNPATMRQAEDRVHRQGQTQNVTIYELWIEDTIEDRIRSILTKKQALAERVIDSLATDVEDLNITTDEWLHSILQIRPEDQKNE